MDDVAFIIRDQDAFLHWLRNDAIGLSLGGWFLDAFGFSLSNLILLMWGLMFTFVVYWFINGVWGVKKLAAPEVVE